MKKIAFITSAHVAFDDRMFYHLALSLVSAGYSVKIICSTAKIETVAEGIVVSGFDGETISKPQKINLFVKSLQEFNPDIIICLEPITIIAANRYKEGMAQGVKIVYDITEWYPSKKNLHIYRGALKFFTFLKLLLFNFYASLISDRFIFGEYYKSRPYKMVFPFKKYVNVGYYPDLRFIQYVAPPPIENELCLGYSGRFNEERGIINFLNAVKALHRKRPEVKIRLKLIGWFPKPEDKEVFKEAALELSDIGLAWMDPTPFPLFSGNLADVHLFFDLRNKDFINERCLPLKLFFYIACGRPVIYSNLKAIRRELDVSSFGHLVNPMDSNAIADIILNYCEHPDIYSNHASNARKIAENEYNWSKIEPFFLQFIQNIS